MARSFRPSDRESKLLSRIESSQERARQFAIGQIKRVVEPLSGAITMKLIEEKLLVTTSKEQIEEQIASSLQKLTRAEDFDIDYQTSPYRKIVPRPNTISLYLTAFVVEQLINHRSIDDIYGSDKEIYTCINRQVAKIIHR